MRKGGISPRPWRWRGGKGPWTLPTSSPLLLWNWASIRMMGAWTGRFSRTGRGRRASPVNQSADMRFKAVITWLRCLSDRRRGRDPGVCESGILPRPWGGRRASLPKLLEKDRHVQEETWERPRFVSLGFALGIEGGGVPPGLCSSRKTGILSRMM